jgi:hypothetical protein
VPYVGAFVAVLLGATLLARDSTLRSRLLPAIAVGSLVLVLSSAATLVKIVRFGEVAEGTFSTGAAIEELGHLLRPLELIQITGIWLGEDYRLPVPPGEEWINTLLAAGVVVCCVGGVVLALRKREPGPLLMLFPALITLAVLESRTAPYATGKMLMLASPGVVLTAAVALGWLGARRRVLAAAAAVPLATGMLISDALAYHDVQLAPVDRLRALEQIGDRLAGEPRRQQEWILVDEHEEFAKYFLRRGRANVALELLTPYQVRDRLTIGLAPLSADVDQMTLEFLGSHPLIVQRRGPDSSRPPANYRRDGGNAFYDVWRRAGDVDVRAHVPIQAVYEAYGRPDCGEVEKLAAQARPGDELVAASAPAEVRFGLTDDRVPKGWPPHPWLPEARLPKTPGEARADLRFPGGRFRVWVLGSFGRPLEVRVDGRAVGRAVGINTAGEWLSAGEVELPAGRHAVELVRSGAHAAPGDGSMLSLGPVVFQRIEPQRLIWTPPRQATESLCGRRLDWIELARRR